MRSEENNLLESAAQAGIGTNKDSFDSRSIFLEEMLIYVRDLERRIESLEEKEQLP